MSSSLKLQILDTSMCRPTCRCVLCLVIPAVCEKIWGCLRERIWIRERSLCGHKLASNYKRDQPAIGQLTHAGMALTHGFTLSVHIPPHLSIHLILSFPSHSRVYFVLLFRRLLCNVFHHLCLKQHILALVPTQSIPQPRGIIKLPML